MSEAAWRLKNRSLGTTDYPRYMISMRPEHLAADVFSFWGESFAQPRFPSAFLSSSSVFADVEGSLGLCGALFCAP